MLFVRKRIADFIQNYKDCPANWKVDSSFRRVENTAHRLYIEFCGQEKEIYTVNAYLKYDNSDLSVIERYLLKKTFGPLVETPSVPTKATNPEQFI